MQTEIHVSLAEIQKIDLTPWKSYTNIVSSYSGYFLEDAGREHYKLIAHFASKFSSPVIDLGTLFGSSAVALKSHTSADVYTYDITDHVGNANKSYKNIEGIYLILKDCNTDVEAMLALHPDLILLDIDPHDGIQEHTFYELLKQHNYSGLLLCDDIHLNHAMEKWWSDVTHEKHDLTKYGHWSGTGLINFNPDKYKIIVS